MSLKLIEKKVDVGLEHKRQVLTKILNCHKFVWHPVHVLLVMFSISCVLFFENQMVPETFDFQQ